MTAHYDTPEQLAERQEDYAQSTGQLSVYTDENWEQLEVDLRTREERDDDDPYGEERERFGPWDDDEEGEPPCGDPRPDPRTHPEYWTE